MRITPIVLATAALCVAAAPVTPPAQPDPLRAGFAAPPYAAKPWTWWHWMNGNITKPGITADLEAMRQVGLGGATIVNVDCDIPRGTVPFMSPEWRDDFKFAVAEADRLGLHLCVENGAGWSSSGGPWNTPANGMQCLTSSETRATGPAPFDALLAQPPTKLKTYHDIAVLAFKDPAPEQTATTDPAARLEIVRASYGADEGGSADVTARVRALVKQGKTSVVASSGRLGGDPAIGQVKQFTVDFTLDGTPHTLSVAEGETLVLPASEGQLATAQLTSSASVSHTFVKPPPASRPADAMPVPHGSVLDLTASLAPDGHLKWDVPAGRWVVLRLGYTPVGVDNHPAPIEGRGLECDKMSKAALDAHRDGFMGKVLGDIGPLAGKALTASLIDSYEVGNQDWTADYREAFKRRRGYDPVPFLPTFARHVVDSPAVTERFLWDLRRTTADLFAENYYAHFAELCHQHGLSSEVEPYTGPFESMQSGSTADLVMGEFWTGTQGHPSVKLAASIAHAYGKRLVAAESFTASASAGRWQNDPYSLKPLGDLMFCQGLNRYTFHRYAMQPWSDRWPGMTMGQYGLNFERTQTWWGQAKPWIDYITRCQYLLQQGRAVADVAYFTGETAPVEMRVGSPPVPQGYDYDAVNGDVLLHGATVHDGRITLASGASYAVLVLPPRDANMTPAMLDGIRKLVVAGATVVGPRPQHSPSLADYPACDDRVRALADGLWGPCDGKRVTENTAGQGHIVWGRSLADVFADQHLAADFTARGSSADARLAFAHRVAGDADVYFVSNQRQHFESADCDFRVTGRAPEVWHPDTGLVEPAAVWSARDGQTTVHLDLDPAGSAFVLFRRPVTAGDHLIAVDGPPDSDVKQPDLKIARAVYAAIDGAGSADVTATVASHVQSGQLSMEASNETLGGDPTHDHRKELRVDYTLDGKAGQVTVREHQTLELPAVPAIGQPPQWDLAVGEDGSPLLREWRDGTVALRTTGGTQINWHAEGVPAPQPLPGGWTLTFPPRWGAPASVQLESLISWTDHPDDGVRYFSGTATYEKTFEVDPARLGGDRELWLDLGTVKNFAEVTLNGTNLPLLWKPPFRVNITGIAKGGKNSLVVKVTNLWPNRLIGDEHLPPDCEWVGDHLKAWPQWLLDGKPSPTGRLTFTTWHQWSKDAPLLPSGLIGPVTLRSTRVARVR